VGSRFGAYSQREPRKRKLEDLHDKVAPGKLPSASGQTYLHSEGRWLENDRLSILCLEDKIVQQAVATVLEAIYEEDFLGFSYGFRPGRGQHDALDALHAAFSEASELGA